MKTRNVHSPFRISAKSFPNGSIFACTAAHSGDAMRRKAVTTELFRDWLSQYGVLAL